MKLVSTSLLAAALALPLIAGPAIADSKEHHAAVKLCKQRYKNAVRGAKYLKHHDREARIEAAKQERERCIALAPK